MSTKWGHGLGSTEVCVQLVLSFGVIKEFWRWMVVTAAQQCQYT